MLGRALATIGAPVRRSARGVLVLAAMAAGGALEGLRPRQWTRPVRAEFRRILAQALAGALFSMVVIATIVGLAMVLQAVYWLGVAGQDALAFQVLNTVVIGEIIPLLTGFLLLGRSGSLALIEIAEVRAGSGWRALEGQGIDAFDFLVVPRMAAFAVAAFSLGVLATTVAVVVGFAGGQALGLLRDGLQTQLGLLLDAMALADFAVFALKLLVIGALVAATAAQTALGAMPGGEPARLLPRAFVRGAVAILLASLLLSAVR